MTISLIISTFDQPAFLAKVRRGLELQTCPPAEILLADDGSGPATRTLIEDWQRQVSIPVRHLWHPHEGFRKIILLNRAVAAARGDYLVFLDGDCVPHRRFLEDHSRLAEPGFWVQGRRCFVLEPFVAGRTPVWRWLLQRRLTGAFKAIRFPFPILFRNQEQRGIIGCNMAFWRQDVLEVNGFDETYLGRGIGPDSDLGCRVYNLGRRRKFVYGRAIVYHLNHPVAPRDDLAVKRARLQETVRSGRTRCEEGLEQYLDTR
jgi:glycosyltransferase involved in cell wall biosynthesis